MTITPGASAITPEMRLNKVAEALKNSRKVDQVTVRQFLGWFGAERRTLTIAARIRDALHAAKLATTPDFQYAYIDGTIAFVPAEGEHAHGHLSLSFPSALAMQSAEIIKDPSHRIGKLPSANVSPTRVAPNTSLSEAATIMLSQDFSQLPVMTSDRDVKGVITWKSVATRALVVPFLLLGMSACREPQFVYSSGDGKHLQMCRTFSIEPERNKALIIWGMRPVSCEAVKPFVAAQLREKGYVQVGRREADLHVILSSFADESVSSVHSISLVVEVVDRSTRRPLWSGHAKLPWTDAPEGSRALQPNLSDFLRPLPASTDAIGSAANFYQARVAAPS